MVKKKVIHLTSVHSPFDTRILHRECRTLTKAGYEVVVIAPHTRDDVWGSIRLRAVPIPRTRLDRMTKTVWKVYRAALDEDGNVYHFHDPELIPVGILLKLHGKRVIYDVHEQYAKDVLSKPWVPRWMRNAVAVATGWTERIAARFLDGLVAANPAIAKQFPRKKTITVHNFPAAEELLVKNPISYAQRPFKIVYIGNITRIRGLFEMVDAMKVLAESWGKANQRLSLVLAGTFSPRELKSVAELREGWQWVEYLGQLNRLAVSQVLSEARVGLVLFHPVPNHVEAMPNKLFEYMSAGLPVVASDFPMWRAIVGRANCGLLVDPLNPKEIAEAIRWLLEHPVEAEEMGRRGQEAVVERYSWEPEGRKLVALYARLT